MFYISLPYFYENFKFNQFFKGYVENSIKSKSDKLVTKFNIEYAYGSFPWSYWNGGINNHQGAAVLARDMQSIIAQTLIPLRIDASNIYIKDTDYYDIHENSILRLVNGTNTIYEISNIGLMEYIEKANLNNKFIVSNSAQLFHEFNSEILNVFQEQDNIEFINIGHNLNYINFSQIKDKNKIEISIGYCQNCSLGTNLQCINNEQKNIYDFSSCSLFINCPFKYEPVNYYKDIEPYLKQGIRHFKITTGPKNLKDFNINIIKSFVKSEYQGECIDEYYRKILE